MNFLGRLSDYDIFAYLPQGLFALAAVDYIAGTKFVLGVDWDVADGLLTLITAYVAGHLVAAPASKLIERWIVRKMMDQPAEVLLAKKTRGWLSGFLFADYYTPLAEPVREDVLKKMGDIDPETADGEDLFWRAYPTVKQDQATVARLSGFLNLYGFSRNLCFVAGATSLALAVQNGWSTWIMSVNVDGERWVVAACLVVVSYLLFQRYLKFHRLYSVEVFTTFAKIAPTVPGPPDKEAR